MAKPKLNEKQKIWAVQEYLNGKTAAAISRELNITSQSVDSLLKRRGIPRRGRRQFYVNESFFEIIDSEEKAYWLGFLFAEGSLDTKRYCLGLKLGKKEKEQVERFKKAIEAEHSIKQTTDGRDAWIIKIGSKLIAKSLLKFGFGAGKTLNIRIPSIPDDLIHHFIRGYFDGDGWISNPDNRKATIGFCSCSKEMILDIHKWITQKIGIDCGSLIIRKRNHIPNQHDSFRLHYSGRKTLSLIRDILYKDATIFMERKGSAFILLKNKMERTGVEPVI